jgi:hypothetical protein
VTAGLGRTTSQRRPQHRRRPAQTPTTAATRTPQRRGGWRRRSARSVTAPSDGPADNATPSVRRRRCRASTAHHGSAEHPRGDSPRPSAESDRDTLNRCGVSLGVAPDGASIDRAPRDANDRRWPVGRAATLPSTEAMTVATPATADDQRGESADSSERGRPIGAAEPDTQAEGLDASTRRTGRR